MVTLPPPPPGLSTCGGTCDPPEPSPPCGGPGPGPVASPCHGKNLWPSELQVIPPLEPPGRRAQGGEPVDQGPNSNGRLEAGESGPQAVVRAEGEGQVVGDIPGD